MQPFLLGIISDTHGLLRPEAIAALKGSHAVIHAGDVGDPAILNQLESIAPVFAVRGNVDTEPWASTLPLTQVVQLQDVSIYVLHNLEHLDLDPAASGFQIVVSGHTHQPKSHLRGGVLYINPGSAGPRRFSFPISLARLDLAKTPWKVEFVELSAAKKVYGLVSAVIPSGGDRLFLQSRSDCRPAQSRNLSWVFVGCSQLTAETA